tara:strand:- start:203 stop:1060 length:858 start_codon:yes stop_codon:yes gene_type:complete
MPELPEVEITVRSIKKYLLNQKIEHVAIYNPKLRYRIPENFGKILTNKKIKRVIRKSKFIIFEIDNSLAIISHLGMTGRYVVVKTGFNIDTSFNNKNEIIKKHNHLEIFFRDHSIIYNDIRKFGFFKICKNNYKKSFHINNLGPDVISKQFNTRYFANFVTSKNVSIKNLLMNQKFVAGLGNIYVNEILYKAKINPNKKSKNLTYNEIRKVIFNAIKIIQSAIKHGGSTILNYHNSEGKTGSYQGKFKVYNREGKNCFTLGCNRKIIKKLKNGRSQFYCPKCQKI